MLSLRESAQGKTEFLRLQGFQRNVSLLYGLTVQFQYHPVGPSPAACVCDIQGYGYCFAA